MDPVLLPQLVKGMEEAVIASKLKRPGDRVNVGETILEVETEKAIVSIESPFSGVIGRFDCQEDDVVCVGKPLCWIRAEQSAESESVMSQSTESITAFSLLDSPSAAVQSTPVALAAGSEMTTLQNVFGKSAVYSSQLATRNSSQHSSGSGASMSAQPAFTPRVVTDADLIEPPICDKINECRSHGLPECGCNAMRADETNASPRIAKTVPMSPFRKTIARRMNASVQNIPASVLYRKADVSDLIKMRLKINRFSNAKISLNDYFTKAVVMALALMPEINSSLDNDQIVQYSDVNIGIAVDASGALYVPVIHQAQKLDVLGISAQTKSLIAKAEQGALTLEDMAHPTFTITNLGCFGVEYTFPLILPPQSGILGIGAVIDEPIEKDGKWESRKKAGLSYSFDHRIIDGALAAKFLQKIVGLLEDPLELIWKE